MSVLGNTALRLDEEQAMLLDVARAFCSEHGGSAAARQRLESDLDFTPELWAAMVDMGWTGIGIPEAAGGAGLSIAAAVPVLESMGRALLGTPLMSTLLAAQLLQRAGGAGRQEALLAEISGGAKAAVALLEGTDWGAASFATTVDAAGRVSGSKRLVTDGACADYLLIPAQRGDRVVLAIVRRSDLSAGAAAPSTLVDLTHRACDLVLDQVPSVDVLDGEAVVSALRDTRLLGALLVAAESAGATAACLDVMVDYLKTRKQFGRLIGSYQALKHPTVEVLTAMDNSRSFIYHAASVLGDDALDRDGEVACRMAKAQATEALRFAADRAVQFHGGMGFTWECDAQLFLRRAQWAQQQYGDAQHHRKRLAALLLD